MSHFSIFQASVNRARSFSQPRDKEKEKGSKVPGSHAQTEQTKESLSTAQRSDSFHSGQRKYEKEEEEEGKERRRLRRAWAPTPTPPSDISSSEQSLSLLQSPIDEDKPFLTTHNTHETKPQV